MTQPDYIFIVGLGRTGSTLMRHTLNCSEQVGLGGESHFFRDLPRLGFQRRPSFQHKLRQVGDISTAGGAVKIVDYIFNIGERHYNFWNFSAKNVDRHEFLRRFLETDRSERALFDLAMAIHAKGKPIRGEKTPAHIFHVPTLLEWFPNSKIIHTFRDPRAVYISSKKKAERKGLLRYNALLRKSGLIFELYSSLNVILTWLRVIQLDRIYTSLYPERYYLCRYEDVVSNPGESVQQICTFLEIDFTDRMLQQTVVNSSYISNNRAIAGFDTSAIDRWRKHLHPWLNKWFVLWCKDHLMQFGYQP